VSKLPPQFADERVAEVLELLAADGAQPAGGPAAAIVAGLAATLTAAAADRSRDEWAEAGGARAQALALRRRILDLASEDAAAFAAARAALDNRSREGDDAQLGETVRLAAEVPLQIGAVAADVAALAGLVAAHGAPDIQTDAAIASLLAAAAAQSATRLVEINLVAGADPELVQRARSYADAAAQAAAARDR
jgi:formiminotetrahydrofolate cyclodeaminase